ncbi:MAG: Trm112 family protein [Planctomycetota bacterium]
MVDRELLDILVCPSCKQKVELEEPLPGDDAQERLVCTACGLRYPIRDDIPIMLIDEADPPKESPQQ